MAARTEQECITAAGEVLAAADVAVASMTPREQAEAAWSPTSRLSVEELEDQIRADRGLPGDIAVTVSTVQHVQRLVSLPGGVA